MKKQIELVKARLAGRSHITMLLGRGPGTLYWHELYSVHLHNEEKPLPFLKFKEAIENRVYHYQLKGILIMQNIFITYPGWDFWKKKGVKQNGEEEKA